MVTINPNDFQSSFGYLSTCHEYKGWKIKYYAPNGGILAVDFGKDDQYFSEATSIDPCEDTKIFLDFAKEVIDEFEANLAAA